MKQKETKKVKILCYLIIWFVTSRFIKFFWHTGSECYGNRLSTVMIDFYTTLCTMRIEIGEKTLVHTACFVNLWSGNDQWWYFHKAYIFYVALLNQLASNGNGRMNAFKIEELSFPFSLLSHKGNFILLYSFLLLLITISEKYLVAQFSY